MLKEQMMNVVDNMQKLKEKAEEVEDNLYQLLKDTLKQLHSIFEEKSSLMKSDF